MIVIEREFITDEQLVGKSEDYRRGYSKGYDDGLAVAKKETETQKITQNSNANLRNTDLISRVEAVKKLNRIGRDYGLSFSDIEGAEYIIRNLPSASEPMGEWVPCSERLPENNELVIVSLGKGYNAVDFDHRTRGMDGARYWYDWDGFVTAWMPMPEPYKKGETR